MLGEKRRKTMFNEGCCAHHEVWLGVLFAGEPQKKAMMARNGGIQRKERMSSFFKAKWLTEQPLSSGFPSDFCSGTWVCGRLSFPRPHPRDLQGEGCCWECWPEDDDSTWMSLNHLESGLRRREQIALQG